MFSMEFAPDYLRSGRFYVYFTAVDGDVRITQFTRSANPDVAIPTSGRDVIRLPHREKPNHNGGTVKFGPDGKLYIGSGDGGGANDPHRRGQKLSTRLGKLLRIEPRPGGGYDVPRDNPFVGRSGARPEIWAYGLRNPYRFSFDRLTGDLVIADVGYFNVVYGSANGIVNTGAREFGQGAAGGTVEAADRFASALR